MMPPPTMSYLRTIATIAVLIAVAIFAWRVSGPVASILHDYDLHLHLLATAPRPAAPKVIPAPPKLAMISCHR
jgi:hypothetical protein